MRITQLAHSNFRRLPDSQISVGPNLALVGPNDSGKSSLLYAIHLAIGAKSNSQAASWMTERDFTDSAVPLTVDLVFEEFSDAERAAFPDEIVVGPPESLSLRLEARLEGEGQELSAVRQFPSGGHVRSITGEQLDAIGWAYVPSSRSLTRELGGSGVIRSLIEKLDLGTDEEAIHAALGAIDEVVDGSQVLKEFRLELAASLSDALPTTVGLDDLKVVSPSTLAGEAMAGMGVVIREGDRMVPLGLQSDGTRALAAIAAYGMAHQRSNIVGIDEPEMHLHPVAQRAVGTLLARSNRQVIVATHASAVAARIDPSHVVALSPARLARQLPPGAPAVQATYVARRWSERLVESLTANRVAFVEGAADRVLLRGAAEKSGFNLDRAGVSVFQLDGADDFGPAYRFYGPPGFDIPFCGLVDSDHETEWAQVLGVAGVDLATKGIFVCSPDLEGEYVSALGPPRVLALLDASPFFTEAAVLSACGAATAAGLTNEALATYCRSGKNKVLAASAIGMGMSAAEAQSMPAPAALIQLLTT